jgi:hypothetical protein
VEKADILYTGLTKDSWRQGPPLAVRQVLRTSGIRGRSLQGLRQKVIAKDKNVSKSSVQFFSVGGGNKIMGEARNPTFNFLVPRARRAREKSQYRDQAGDNDRPWRSDRSFGPVVSRATRGADLCRDFDKHVSTMQCPESPPSEGPKGPREES